MARPHEDETDEAISDQLEAAYQARTSLEDEHQQIRAQQVENSERIANLEQEQHYRRRAGFMTADLGGNGQPGDAT